MNKVILMGRLARDPEVRYTQTGKPVATFTLAVDRPFRRPAEGQPQQPTADFIPIVAWNKLAELCGNYLQKGRQVLVEGRMQVRNYEAQDGSKRYVTEVIMENMDFVGSKGDNAGGNAGGFAGGFQAAAPSGAPAQSSPAGSAGFGQAMPADDDIPF